MWDRAKLQQLMQEEDLDGWLLYDFQGINPIARRLAPLPGEGLFTRRWAYFLPVSGEPLWLVHRIEHGAFANSSEKVLTYVSWGEFHAGLAALVGEAQRIALEYSPGNAIPYVSRVDAGTIELLRELDLELVSSADLVQATEACWSHEQLASHRRAASICYDTVQATFAWLGECLRQGQAVNELSATQYAADRLRKAGLVFDHDPNVSVNAHSGNPHFQPSARNALPIRPGDLILFDLWGKEQTANAVYADITWMAFAGHGVPAKYTQIFNIVKAARDAAIQFVQTGMRGHQVIHGYQVDDVAREVIKSAGYGDAFIHRTGHSIGAHLHGFGVNLDNLETQDRRRLMPGVAFSIEPGIYLPEFGIRSEVNMVVGEDDAEVTTQPVQQEIARLM